MKATYFVIYLVSISWVNHTFAQENFVPPTQQMMRIGVASAVTSIPLINEMPLFAEDFSGKKIFEVLSRVPTNERRSRGAHEIALFKNISPSVVYISTNEGAGTGSVISEGFILTNSHVVGDASFVGVLYKP